MFFQVALAILKVAKKDLLNQDFEGLMKYFRVNIPKTYRSEENAKQLLVVAKSIKLKKMSKYQKEWLAIKEAERQREDPVVSCFLILITGKSLLKSLGTTFLPN